MKIGLTGSISVGKTSLVKELSKLDKFKDYKIFTERSKYLRDLGIPLNTESTLEGQLIFKAERASELLHPKMITDRSIIDVMAFTQLSEEINFLQKKDFKNLALHLIPKYDLIFYIPTDGVELEDNNIRSTDEEYRKKLDVEIKDLMRWYSHMNKNMFYLKGNLSLEERVDYIKEVIDEQKTRSNI